MIRDHTIILSETKQTYELTPHCDNLSFSSADPGGYGSVTFDLSRDINAEEFESFAYIAVYDIGTGEQVGGGRMSNPGRGFNDRGEGVWKMSALGEGLASTQERKVPYFLIDSRLESFKNGAGTSVNRKWEVGDVPNPDRDEPGLVLTINQTSVGPDAYSNTNFYDVAQYPDQRIAGVYARHRAGRDSGNNELEWQLRGSPNVDFLVQTWARSPIKENSQEVGTHWTDGDYTRFNFVYVRRNTTMTVATDLDYYLIIEARVQTVRLDRNGNDIIGGNAYSRDGDSAYVLCHEAVIDAVARFCPRLDIRSAQVDEGIYEHIQLVWSDGVNTHDVLAYLMSLESTFTWGAYEKQDNGLWRFAWRDKVFDGGIRYWADETSLVDFEFTGGEEEELVEFWYTGTTGVGLYETQIAELENTIFDRLNIHPTDTDAITLESLSGWDWKSTAALAGFNQLVASRFRAMACRATVEGKVYDSLRRRWVNVSQIEPGWIVAFPQIDQGLRLANEGEFTVIGGYLKQMGHSDSTGRATLEVNSPTVDEMRALAATMTGRRDL